MGFKELKETHDLISHIKPHLMFEDCWYFDYHFLVKLEKYDDGYIIHDLQEQTIKHFPKIKEALMYGKELSDKKTNKIEVVRALKRSVECKK